MDKRVRDLPHPSFYSISDPLDWLGKMFLDSKYHNYLMIIFIASLSSVFVFLSLIIGPLMLLKEDKFIAFISIIYILYFLLVTGPVLSPKYLIPILPCLFLYQALTLSRILELLRINTLR